MKKIRTKKTRGLTIIYTGKGKGKTTAALGLALRALGRGKRVLIVHFMKSATYGEHVILKKLPRVTVKVLGKGFCKIAGDRFPFNEHKKATQDALLFARQAMRSRKYDMIILDEINCALLCRLLTVKDVLPLLAKKPCHVHLVLTGRGAPRSLIKKGDLVSDVREVKHPFHKGIPAQEGIEF